MGKEGNRCGECRNGTAGLIRATASGTLDQVLSEEPTTLDFATYDGNAAALEQFVRRKPFYRPLVRPELRSMGVIADAKGKGDLQLYRSNSNGKETDPKKYRSSVAYAGPIVKKSPPGFVPARTATGKRIYEEVRSWLVAVADSESAAASSKAYDLTWQGMPGENAIIGPHTDQSVEDVDSEGRAKERTARVVCHNGPDFFLRFDLKAVHVEEEEDEDGKTKYTERMRTITSCEIEMSSPAVYVLSHRLAGRERVGTMMIDGEQRSVVLYHSTRPVNDQEPVNRSIMNIDTKFDTEAKEEAFIARFLRGDVNLLPPLAWYTILEKCYSSAANLRNHGDRMLEMMSPFSTDDCSCRCCGGRVDGLDVRGEGVPDALDNIRRMLHGGDQDDEDDEDDDEESDGETGDEDDTVRLLDGSPASTNKNGVPIAPGIRVTTFWREDEVTVAGKGADYDGVITLVTKDDEGKCICEVSYHAQNEQERFVFQHETDELYPTDDAKAEDIIYNPNMPMTLLPLLFTCSGCSDANHQLCDSDDLVSDLCRSCMSTERLGKLAFCDQCGDYDKCVGFLHPESGVRTFVCTGKEGRTDGVELNSSNIAPHAHHAICYKCENQRIKITQTASRRAKGMRANNYSRDAAFWRKFFRLLKEKRKEMIIGNKFQWKNLAPLLEDEPNALKLAYRKRWVGANGAGRNGADLPGRKCGKCARCKNGTQCVVDLKSFEAFMKKRPDEKFGHGRSKE